LEIEAKFRVPDDRTFRRLLEAPALAGFALGQASLAELHDRYLDTAGGALLGGGFACRLRRDGEQVTATLKGLGEAEGAVHRRVEHEFELPALLPPMEWPAGPIRDMALQLCGNEPLTVLFELEQIRHTRRVYDGERTVADLNVGRVEMHPGGGTRARLDGEFGQGSSRPGCPQPGATLWPRGTDLPVGSYLELEIELLPSGTEQDLERISRELETDWQLRPEDLSKFHRALARLGPDWGLPPMVQTEAAPHLTSQERASLARLAQERAVLSRRARLLLAWDEGASQAEMLARSGLSPRRARYWRWAFRQRRLGIFPRRAVELASALETPRHADEPGSLVQDREPPLPVASFPGTATAEGADLLTRPGIEPDDPMSEAGRKVLRFHFQRMLQNEPGTRKDEDIEALHDMRVATRRMRAAFRVFEGYFESSIMAPFLKVLRRSGRVLGEVRDLDVFRDKVRVYLATLPEAQRGGLDGFLVELQSQREGARMRLLARLDSRNYHRFVTGFAEFVGSPGMGSCACGLGDGEPAPYRVRHVAPVAIMERLAAVRAYGEWVTAPGVPLTRLHALRIATKRLRYTLEFFAEVLGPESKGLIRKTVALQDHLGLLQDGVVASGILRDFLVWGTWGRAVEGKRLRTTMRPVIAPGVATYLAMRQSEIQQLVAGFPAVWACLTEPDFSRGVASAVGQL